MWEAQTGQCFLWSSGSSTSEVMEGCGRLTTFLGSAAGATPLVNHLHVDISWGSCLKGRTSLSILHCFHPLGEAHGFILCLAKLLGLLMHFCTCLIVAVCKCIPVQLGEIVLILVLCRLWAAFYNCGGRIIG